MDFNKILSVSNMQGLYELYKQRPDGLMVRYLDGTNKIQFVANRLHSFSFLYQISIYTQNGGSEELLNVFKSMLAHEQQGTILPDVKADNNTLLKYMEKILPAYNPTRVYASDVKRLIKWYNVFKTNNLLHIFEKTEETAEPVLQTQENS